MKRFTLALLSLLLCVNLVACAAQPAAPVTSATVEPTQTPTAAAETSAAVATPTPVATEAATASADASAQNIEVNKGLFDVEVTIPVAMLGQDTDVEKIIADAKAAGASEVVQNADKSLTYRMSKAVHAKMLADLKTNFDKSIQDIKTGGKFTTVKDITYNDDMSAMELTVDRKAFEASVADGLVVLSLMIVSAYYQTFDGVKEYKMTLTYKDSATGEVFDTKVLPDAMQQTAGQ